MRATPAITMKRLAAVVALASLLAGCITPDEGGGGSAPGPVSTVTIGSETITTTVANGLTVVVSQALPDDLPPLPTGMTGPVGALDVQIGNVSPVGSSVQLTIALQTSVQRVVKLIDGAWDPFTPDGTTGASLSADGRTITVDLVDGGRGDADGLANGVIADPIQPVTVDAVSITSTNPTPLYSVGEPYSFQLEATGPDQGTISWSVIARALPDGLTLDSSGLVSGTPTAMGGSVRVQATDSLTSDTKLLTFQAGPGVSPPSPALSVSSGSPLPEGSGIIFGESGGNNLSQRLGMVRADGSINDDFESFKQFIPFYQNLSPTEFILPTPTPDGSSGGPVEVLDTDTGAVVATLEPSTNFRLNSWLYSPDRQHVAMFGYDSATGEIASRVFATSNWSEERTLPISTFPGLGWLSDSSAIVNTISGQQPNPFTDVQFLSAIDPSLDRVVTLNDSCQLLDVFPSGRMAYKCGYPAQAVLTASSLDGSDVRAVTAPCAFGSAQPCSMIFAARFSPSGSSLAFFEALVDGASPGLARLSVAPDVANAALTGLTEPSPTIYPIPFAWIP